MTGSLRTQSLGTESLDTESLDTESLGTGGMSMWDTARLVVGREVAFRLRDKSFLFSTALTLVIVVAAVVVPALIADDGPREVTVAAVGADAVQLVERAEEAAAVEREGTDSGVTLVVREVDGGAMEGLLTRGDVDLGVVPRGEGFELVADDEVPGDVAALMDAAAADTPPVELPQRLLDTSGDQGTAQGVGFAFAILFFTGVFGFGLAIAQSVTEEKASRVVEILVAAVPVRGLLLGKVLAGAALALGQVVMIGAVAALAAAATDQGELLPLLVRNGGWFVVFFVLGFGMLACLWAAAGALASRVEDLGSTTLPLQMVVMIPYFAALFITEGMAQTVMAYVPLTSPIVMPRLLLLGEAVWWQALLSLGLVAITGVLLLVIGARLYRGSLLRTGKTSWRQAWAASGD